MIFFELARRFMPQIILAAVAMFILAAVYHFGASNARAAVTAHYEAILAEHERAAAQAMAKALEEQQQNAKAAMEAERMELEARAATEQQFKVITKTVTQYVQKNPDKPACTSDADFMRIWNSANSGAAAAPSHHP